MRMDRARGRDGQTRRDARLRRARRAQNFREMQHRAEVARLELERAPDVAQAFGIAPEEIVQSGALVPGLGEVRRAAQQPGEARLGDIVAPRRDVAGREVELERRGSMRM